MFVLLFGTGEMFQIVPYLIQRPNIVLLICMYGSSTFAGIFAYLSMVKEVGGVGTALVSTLRKVGTVVLSFVLQGRVFSWGYAMGGGMIVGSLLLQKVMKGKLEQEGNEIGTSSTPQLYPSLLSIKRLSSLRPSLAK